MGFGNMQRMMKEAQKLKAQMDKVQEELQQRTVEATAGGGMVKVTVSGGQELKSLEINPEAVDPDDLEMLQDMIVAAVNEGMRRAKEMVSEEMGKLMGGMKLPPGLF